MLSVPSELLIHPLIGLRLPARKGASPPGAGAGVGAGLGKFVGGLVIGLIVGLVFSEMLFPDGFNSWVEHQAQDIRSHVPGR